MLETSKERVELLKAGISGRAIECMYVKANGLVVVKNNVLREVEDVPK